jgi:hypothetical protein
MADVNQLIQDFYRVSREREFARDFNFRILQINTGNAVNQAGQPIIFNDDDLVYVKSATLPERAITNVPVPFMGLNFNLPGNATYPGSEGYSLTFYADAQSNIRQKFEEWSIFTFNDQNSTGQYLTPTPQSYITLVQLDNQMNRIPGGEYKLIGVSPRSVGAISYNIAAGTGETVEFTTTLAYHYFQRQL